MHFSCNRQNQDCLVADNIGEAVDLSEELRIDEVNFLPLPQPGCRDLGASSNHLAARQHSCKFILDVQINFKELSPQMQKF